ncbi:MAG: transposase [Saprospiraceae bacterium]|nr:transposase [Saprospiraceae bacterium]
MGTGQVICGCEIINYDGQSQTPFQSSERSFAWFNFFRRLSRGYAKTADSSAAFIQISFIDIILARISN